MKDESGFIIPEPGWQAVLQEELKKPYTKDLRSFLHLERILHPESVYPSDELLFHAFNQTPYDKVKVIIVGQDPYHGPNQAHGLCFSVPKGTPIPPSLRNIFKELHDDLQIPPPMHGCLISWATQGVFLLNTTLSVYEGAPLSHHGKGWERFTDAVIQKLAERKDPLIFVLWGKFAQNKCRVIMNDSENKGIHTVLQAAHPSPFSAAKGFFGCRHFSQINEILMKNGNTPIFWEL